MSNDNIKITMLGTTGSGKTCFMVGMYAVMQLGVHGFTLSAQDSDEDIDLSDKWEQLLEGGEERYPQPTDQTCNYAFDFSYGFRKLMGFNWLDYRGGALRDKNIQQDFQTLEKNLRESSCVFLCVSGEYLKKPIESQHELQNLKRQTRVERMNHFLQKLYNENGPIPVVIAITKFDLCAHRTRDDITEDIKKLFNPLFTNNEKGWLVMICPVSLGKGLADNMTEGIIEPINLHLPLSFAIYSRFVQEAAKGKAQENDLREESGKLQGKNWFMKQIKREEITRIDSSLKRTQAQTNDLQEKMQLLAQELGKVKMYFNGEETEIGI